MKRLAALTALLFAVLALPTASTASSPASGKSQPIRIESWLYRSWVANGATNPLVSGTVGACAKVWIGDTTASVPDDQGGAPLWTAAGYALPAFGDKCGDWTAVGGYRFEGNGHLTNGQDNILFARHTITLAHGTLDIQFVGRYDPTFAGTGRWVISGGTGDYQGLQGTGTWSAQGYGAPITDGLDLYFMHTEVGTVHATGQ